MLVSGANRDEPLSDKTHEEQYQQGREIKMMSCQLYTHTSQLLHHAAALALLGGITGIDAASFF
jgi:hypothetical protein